MVFSIVATAQFYFSFIIKFNNISNGCFFVNVGNNNNYCFRAPYTEENPEMSGKPY